MTDSGSSPASADIHGSIEHIFDTDTVCEATAELAHILEAGGEIASLPHGHDDNHDRLRVVVDDDDILFLKTLRNNRQDSVIDLFCDLLGHRIAETYNAPVAELGLIELDDHGPALVMPYLDADCRDSATEPMDCENADELPALLVMETWIRNDDDTDEHFMFEGTDSGKVLRFIDHGHALYRRFINEIEEPADVIERDREQRWSANPEKYGVHRLEDTEKTLSLIANTTDQQIKEFVVDSLAPPHWRDKDVPIEHIWWRADVAREVIEKHYAKRSETAKMEQRREFFV